MRKFCVATSATILFFLTASAALMKADFTGTWELDAARSAGLPPGVQQKMTLVHKGDRIEIDAVITSDQGEQKITDVYILSGQEVDFTPTLPGGATGKGKRTAKWSADGNGIEVAEVATVETPQGTFEVRWQRKWTLSADGKELTIEMKVESAAGSQESKRIFVKK